YSAMATSAAILRRTLEGRHSRKNINIHCHCLGSVSSRTARGESSRDSQLSNLGNSCGFAQGSAYDTDICPPFARLVSRPEAGCLSTTITSWPARLSHHAVEVPILPLPRCAAAVSCQRG